MINPKNVLGAKIPWQPCGQPHPAMLVLLEAHGGTIRYRETRLGKGTVEKTARRDDPETMGAYQAAACAALAMAYGEDFSGYEHNYAFVDGTAWEKEDGDDRDEAGRRWGRCPYCEKQARLGYKDHCADCLR